MSSSSKNDFFGQNFSLCQSQPVEVIQTILLKGLAKIRETNSDEYLAEGIAKAYKYNSSEIIKNINIFKDNNKTYSSLLTLALSKQDQKEKIFKGETNVNQKSNKEAITMSKFKFSQNSSKTNRSDINDLRRISELLRKHLKKISLLEYTQGSNELHYNLNLWKPVQLIFEQMTINSDKVNILDFALPYKLALRFIDCDTLEAFTISSIFREASELYNQILNDNPELGEEYQTVENVDDMTINDLNDSLIALYSIRKLNNMGYRRITNIPEKFKDEKESLEEDIKSLIRISTIGSSNIGDEKTEKFHANTLICYTAICAATHNIPTLSSNSLIPKSTSRRFGYDSKMKVANIAKNFHNGIVPMEIIRGLVRKGIISEFGIANPIYNQNGPNRTLYNFTRDVMKITYKDRISHEKFEDQTMRQVTFSKISDIRSMFILVIGVLFSCCNMNFHSQDTNILNGEIFESVGGYKQEQKDQDSQKKQDTIILATKYNAQLLTHTLRIIFGNNSDINEYKYLIEKVDNECETSYKDSKPIDSLIREDSLLKIIESNDNQTDINSEMYYSDFRFTRLIKGHIINNLSPYPSFNLLPEELDVNINMNHYLIELIGGNPNASLCNPSSNIISNILPNLDDNIAKLFLEYIEKLHQIPDKDVKVNENIISDFLNQFWEIEGDYLFGFERSNIRGKSMKSMIENVKDYYETHHSFDKMCYINREFCDVNRYSEIMSQLIKERKGKKLMEVFGVNQISSPS